MDSTHSRPVVSPPTRGWGDFSRTREEGEGRQQLCAGVGAGGLGGVSPAPADFSTCRHQTAPATSSPLGRGPCKVLRALALQTLLLLKSRHSPHPPSYSHLLCSPWFLNQPGVRMVPLQSSNQTLDLFPRRMYVYPSIILWVPSRYSLRFVVQKPQFFSKVGHSAR